MGLLGKIRKELRRFDDRVRETGRDIDDQVRAAASDADDWRRENPELSAMIPFTPKNQALMAGGGAAGGSAMGGLIGSGAGGAAGATGLGSLGQLGLGLDIIGAGLQYRAAKKAASAQKEAAYEASKTARDISAEQMALYKQIWEKQQADQLPYLQQGQSAIGKLGSLMGGADPFEAYLQKSGLSGGLDSYLGKKGLAGGQFNQNNPQYQFLLKQGQQALDRSAAARGMGYSGAQMKAAQQFGQGLASQQYDTEYNRAAKEYFNKYDQARGQFGDYYNRLAGIAQGGQQTAQSLGGMGGQYAQNAANTLASLSNAQTNILGQQANARASGYIGQANAINQGLGNMIDIYGISKKYG